MKFQIESPMPLNSLRLFALLLLTCLLVIYLAIKFKKSLMFLVLDAICLIELCNEIG